jgi:hypothetical protein
MESQLAPPIESCPDAPSVAEITPPAMDKYDAAVAFLTEHPEEIDEAWNNPSDHSAGCLFAHTSFTGKWSPANPCGCLTQVRGGCGVAQTEEMTRAISGDFRLPSTCAEITVDHLPIFAAWQRRIDRALNRV